MSTLGVKPFSTNERVYPIQIPTYSYQYPSIMTFKLGYKGEGTPQPFLPSFRRNDVDMKERGLKGLKHPNIDCERSHLLMNKSYVDPELIGQLNYKAGIPSIQREICKHHNSPDEFRESKRHWSNFLDRHLDRYKIRLPELKENCCKDLEHSGYAYRYLRPIQENRFQTPLDRYIPSAAQQICLYCKKERVYLPY